MSVIVNINGVNQTIPSQNDMGWGPYTTTTIIALAQAVFPKNGGNFFLTGDVNMGTNFGLIVKYIKSLTTPVAQSGVIRLANADVIAWRNAANTGDDVLSVDSSNNLNWPNEINAMEFNSASDRNFKENIVNITSPLDKLLELNGVTFNWKSDQVKSVGLIAQDVEKIFPELVKQTSDIKHLNYLGIIGLLVEAVKDLHTEVELLKIGFNNVAKDE